MRGVVIVVSALLLVLTEGAMTFAQSAENGTAVGGSSSSGKSAALPVVTLNDAIRAAQVRGESFKIAQDNLEAAHQQLLEARAANGVSLSGSGAYFYQDNLPGVSAPLSTPSNLLSSDAAAQDAISQLSSSPVGNNYRAGAILSGPSTNVSVSAEHLSETSGQNDQVSAVTLSGKQTILDGYPGGRGSGTYQEAKDSFRVSRLSYDAQLLSLKLQVKQAYYTLLGDQAAVAVQQANLAQAKEDFSRVEGLVSASEATKLDLLQARVAVGQAEIAVGSAKDQVVIDRKNLSLAVGWPLDKSYRVANAPAPGARTLDEASAVRIALANRPELKELSLEVASGQVALALAKSEYVPVVSATAGITFEHDWTASYNMGTYNAGVSVSMPVFENGLLSAQVKRAQAQLDSLRRQQTQEAQTIEIAVENALFSVVQSKKSLDLSRQSVEAAAGQYALEKDKRKAGLVTNLDVLQASSALAQSKSSLEKARNAYDLAVLSLNNTLGL